MDEIKIKAVIDAAESAKTVAELKKALKDLRSAALQVEEGSDAFRRITQSAGELQDKIGDLNATTKALGDDLFKLRGFTQIAQGIAGAFSAVQSATALWGGENEAVEKSLLKVQAAMGLLNGIMAVGEILQKESAASLLAQNVVRSVTVGLVGKETVAKAQLAVANGTATLTQRALNAAMTANPAGILIATVTALIGVYYLFSSSTDELKAKNDALNSSLQFSQQLMEYQQGLITRELENRKKLAEARGADAAEIAKIDKQIIDNEEKASKQKIANYKKEIAQKRKQRTDYFMEGEDDLANEINKEVEAAQAKLDIEEKKWISTNGYANQFALDRAVIDAKETKRISDENKKRTQNNKNNLDKQKEDYKGYVLDIQALDDLIYNNQVRLQQAILDSWSDTYDKKLISNLEAEKASIKEIEDAYDKFLENEKKKFEASSVFKKGKLTEGTAAYYTALDNQFQTFIQNQIQQNTDAGKKLLQAKQVEEKAITATQKLYAQTRTQLLEDEIKRQRELLLESSKVLLSTDEYKRFYQFIDLQQDIVREKANKNLGLIKANYEKQREAARQSIAEYLKLQEELESAKKKQDEELKKPNPNMDALDKLSTDIEYITGQLAVHSKGVDKTIDRIMELTTSIESWDGMIKELNKTDGDFQANLSRFVTLTEVATTELDYYTNSISIVSNNVNEFSKTLDDADQGLIDYTDTQSKWGKNLQSILNLTREVNKGEIGDSVNTNKLLAALYKDKYDTIVDFENKTNDNLDKVISDRINLLTNEATKAGTINDKAVQDRLKSLGELKGKKFAVQPIGPDQFGLDKLATLLPQELDKLNGKLQDRFDTALDVEQRFYDQSLFNLYKLYQEKKNAQGEDNMSYEEYLKEEEKLRLNHEENQLVIQTTYGKKGQENFVDFAKKRTDKAEQERLTELEKRYEFVQKIVELEKLASDLIMQELNQRYAASDRLSQQRYDQTIKKIDDEQQAYEDLREQRTAQQQQELDIQSEFDQRRQEAEDLRRSEQNAIAKKQFEAQKTNALAQLVIEYGIAIAKAFGKFGIPAAFAPAGFLAAQGVLQAALIANQEFVPQYAEGGLVTGEGGPKDDKILAKLSNGESVINAKSTKMFAPVLSAINQAGGGNPIPMLADGGIVKAGGFDHIHTDTMTTNSQTGSYNDTVALDEGTLSALDQIFSKVSVNTNEITNAQNQISKVERRTKF